MTSYRNYKYYSTGPAPEIHEILLGLLIFRNMAKYLQPFKYATQLAAILRHLRAKLFWGNIKHVKPRMWLLSTLAVSGVIEHA